SSGGSVNMVVRQLNSDGAGPYLCIVNDDNPAHHFEVTRHHERRQVVHHQIGSQQATFKDDSTTDFLLNVALPTNQACTGKAVGKNNVCLVRCQNFARTGAFGGIFLMQMAGASYNTAAAARGTESEEERPS
ncbi:hypothetical protein M406DRAFT_251743, partial [Cryphonectria parasitica EP155]